MKNSQFSAQHSSRFFLLGIVILLAGFTIPAFSQNQTEFDNWLKTVDLNVNTDDCAYPPEWNVPIASDAIHGMIAPTLHDITINGIRVNACDYLGCFFEDLDGTFKCGGVVQLISEKYSHIFVVNGDDMTTPEKEGFAYGEEIKFKLFSWSNGGGVTVDVEDDDIVFDTISYPGNFNWYPLGLTKILSITCEVDFNWPINDADTNSYSFAFKNGWNTFICPANAPKLDDLISQWGARLIQIKEVGGTGVIWPEKNIFTIREFLPGQKYMLNISADKSLAK